MLKVKPQTAKILIIEDSQPLCQVYSAALCHANPQYEAVLAYNGMEGIKIALRDVPDLVILDLNLPDISGIQVAQHLRDSEKLSATPIIIATGDSYIDMNFAAEINAAAFLLKPFHLKVLTDAVEEALA